MQKPKTKTLKRVLSGVLAAVMCFGLIPVGTVSHAADQVSDKTTLYIQTVNNTTGAALDHVGVKIECTTAGQYQDYGISYSKNGGKISLEVPVGYYRITGINAPEGYRIETTPELVYLQKTNTGAPITTVVAYAECPLVVKQIDAGTLAGVAGAKFRVTNADGSLVGEGTTGSDGCWTLPYIAPGDYTVTEVQTPAGYHPSSPQNITITESGDGDPFLVFVDSEKNVVAVRKTDKATGMPLANAHFTITTAAGGAVAGGNDLVTDSEGMVYLSNLSAGNYRLTETAAPEGYILDQRVVSFDLAQNTENKMISVTNSRPGAVAVYSKDSGGQPLAGTHFVVYDKDNRIVCQDSETDANGCVHFENLEPGTYTITATKASEGHVLQVNTKQVIVRKNQVTTETFISSTKPSLVIICQDDTGKKISGASFAIQAQNGKEQGPYVTDANGSVKIDNLDVGGYLISQTGVPAGYVAATGTINRALTADHTETVTFVVKTKPFIEIMHYVKGTTVPLAGAKFELWQNNQKIAEDYAAADGRVVFEDVNPGEYTIRHVSTPDGYTIDTASQNINVLAANSGYLQFTSSRNSAIMITKVDSVTGSPLSGAVFQVRDLQGNVLDTVTTTADGTASTKTLAAGQYVISEVQAPAGYVPDETARIVTVVADQLCAQRFTNQKMSSIVIRAVDYSGAPVKDAQFTVTSLATGQIVDTVVTDESGMAVTKVLNPAQYIVRETTAPAGYVMDTKVISNVLVETGAAMHLTFMHSLQSIIQIRNEDAKGNPISGGQFKVTNQQTGYVVGYFTTDESGIVSTPIVAAGTYQVAQVVAADGFVTQNEVYTVTVKDNQASIVRFVNGTQSVLNIKKVDSQTGASLAGVVFTLADEQGHVVGRYTTDSTGCVSTQPLKPGTYLLREYKAADGYLIDEACKTNVVIKADEPTYVQMTNTKKPVIQITKEDADTGALLAGAEFTVEKNGSIIGTYVTDVSGLATTEELEPGTYTVYESKAPNGYTLNPTPATVKVRAGQTTSIYVQNQKNAGLTVTKVSATGNPLAGAEFVLYTTSGEKIADLTTQFNGTASYDGLDAGQYVLRETKAPAGYKIDTAPKLVQIKSNAGANIKIVNQSMASIVIQKTDADSGAALSGAEFEITNATGNVVAKLRTDAAGLAQTDVLEDGTYYVKETVAPNGYMVDTAVRTVQVRAGETVNLHITNSAKAAVHIHLNDAVNNQPLGGGEFVIRTESGVVVGQGKTENGLLVIPALPNGNYIVSQITAPDGYIKDMVSQSITVISNQVTHVYFLNQPMTGLIIENVVTTTHKPLAGGIFEVYDATGKQIYHGTTDDTGWLNAGILAPGKYTIKQVATAKGYTIVTNTQTVTVSVNIPTTAVFENRPLTTLLINKVDNVTRDGLEGATFRVQSVRGEFETRVTTDEAGFASVDNLEPGYYIVTEVKAPDGYILKGTYQFAYIRSGNNTELTFTNEKYTGLVIENVVLDTHEPLAGGVFEVWELNTEHKVFEGTTDNTGVLHTNILTPGKYLIKHLATVDGYTIVTATQIVEIKTNEPTHAVFNNKPMGTLEILKVDEATRDPLAGATFKVVKANSSFEVSVTTDATGIARVSDLEEGNYVVTETNAPECYRLNNVAQNVTIRSSETSRLTFANQKLTGIVIVKTDADTGAALAGAHFQIADENGTVLDGNFVSDAAGRIETGPLTPGRYTIKEMVAPTGYVLDTEARTVTVTDTTPTVVPFTNRAMAGITIQKVDAADNKPLAGAEFEVWNQNSTVKYGDFTTDSTGTVATNIMTPGTYIIKEVKAPNGYLIDVPSKTVTLPANQQLIVKFSDTAKPSLQIEKLDATDSSKPLAGATFKVYDSKGSYVGDYTTDESGLVFVDDLAPGQYRITEVKAPAGYVIDSNSKTVTVKAATQAKVTFTNKPMTGIVITKIDADTAAPLAGAVFEISELNGSVVNSYTTDATGVVHTETLAPGKYVVKEIKAPEGYVIDDASQIVDVVAGKATSIRITNTKKTSLQIWKMDETNGNMLAGAHFSVQTTAGEHVTTVITGTDGIASVPTLTPGSYIVTETKAPEGYLLDATPQTVEVKTGTPAVVKFYDKPLAALRIQKVDGKTGESLSGAVFKVVKENGDYVGEYRTELDGIINIPTMAPGRYVITEISAPDGYIVDSTARTVEVKTGVPTVITVENNRTAGLQIRKTVTQTGEPLAGVTFKVKKADGTLVGNYTTDSMGLIYVSLEPGEYNVQETFAPDGYVVDEKPHFVTVKANEPTVLEITNDRMSNVRIHKIDAETGKGIYGVTFEIKDSRNNYIGTYKTDDQGYIDLTAVLPDGRYVVTETQAAAGYVLDPIPRTVKVSPSEPTEIIWENSREKGQIKIVKYSADDNAALNIPANSPLEGAEFTITAQDGRVIDTVRTNAAGVAFSGALDIGTYTVQETKAPAGYSLNSKPVQVNITSKSQEKEIEFYNNSMNVAVNIEKRGEAKVRPGNSMKYYLMNIKNNSTVAVDNFFFTDTLPTDAVRAQTLYTGTWSSSVYYKIEYKTNMYDYRTLAQNLNSQTQYSYDLSSKALNLESGEYVTHIRFVFGTVPAGFHEQVSPVLYAYVLPSVTNNYQIINRCEVGAQYDGNWVTDADSWITLVVRNDVILPEKLPTTGF